jgi:thioredoxin-like negative regulator of GroEL
MRQPSTDLEAFISEKPAAVIQFDAEWDVTYRSVVRAKMIEAEKELGKQANFGEVNCDRSPELARSLPAHNVPLVAYYRDGKLVHVLIGAHQNILARLESVLREDSKISTEQ